MKQFLAILALLTLAACAGNTPWENPQQYAGITHVNAIWTDDGSLKRVEVWNGKEGESFDIAADLKAGTVTWKGKGVRAFEAFTSRAEVESFVAEKFADSAPAIRDGLVDIVSKLAGL